MHIKLYRCTLVQLRNTCSTTKFPEQVKNFLEKVLKLCKPKTIRICDGSTCEVDFIKQELQCSGILKPLPKYNECSLLKLDPNEGENCRIYLVSNEKSKAFPEHKCGFESRIKTEWMETSRACGEIEKIFGNCMEGKTLWLIPYALGQKGSQLSSIGVQLTDSPLAALMIKSLARGMGGEAVGLLNASHEAGDEASKRICLGLHSIGKVGREEKNPDGEGSVQPVIYHDIDENQVFSYGSLWPGMSLLAGEAHGLRLSSKWFHLDAEGAGSRWETAVEMSAISVKDKDGKTFYLGTGSGRKSSSIESLSNFDTLGKRNIEISKVSTNTTWLIHDKKNCSINAIDPYSGSFDKVSGLSCGRNPKLTSGMVHHTVFLNTGETQDGGVYWESLGRDRGKEKVEREEGETQIYDYKGEPWSPGYGRRPEHPEAKYLTPIKEMNNYDMEAREKPDGVPLSGFIFQTDRAVEGAPLLMEVEDWEQGILFALGMRYEDSNGKLYWDPFYMRDSFGYNYCDYLKHLLKIGEMEGLRETPRIFIFNGSALDRNGKRWPGGLENARAMEWILRRLKGDVDSGKECPFTGGIIPNREKGFLDLKGIEWGREGGETDAKPAGEMEYWKGEVDFMRELLEEEIPYDAPYGLRKSLDELSCRLEKLSGLSKDGDKGIQGAREKEEEASLPKSKEGSRVDEEGKKSSGKEEKPTGKCLDGDVRGKRIGGLREGKTVDKVIGESGETDGKGKSLEAMEVRKIVDEPSRRRNEKVIGEKTKEKPASVSDKPVEKSKQSAKTEDKQETGKCSVDVTGDRVGKTDGKMGKRGESDEKISGSTRNSSGEKALQVCKKDVKDVSKREGEERAIDTTKKGPDGVGKRTCDEEDSKELSSAAREIFAKSKTVLRVLGRKAMRGARKAAARVGKKISKGMDRTIEKEKEKEKGESQAKEDDKGKGKKVVEVKKKKVKDDAKTGKKEGGLKTNQKKKKGRKKKKKPC